MNIFGIKDRADVIADILGLECYGKAGISNYNPRNSIYWRYLKPLIEELIDEKFKKMKQ